MRDEKLVRVGSGPSYWRKSNVELGALPDYVPDMVDVISIVA